VGVLVPRDRLGWIFAGFVAANAILIAVLAWQAVESQEVKGSLEGGFAQEVEIVQEGGDPVPALAEYVNRGDRTVTLEGAGLIEPENLEVVEWTAGAPGSEERSAVEGYEVAPGEAVEVGVLVTATGAPATFADFRLQYRAGGRAGQTP
jgi:hypothetical protein